MGYGAILGQAPQIEEALADYDKTIKGTYPIASGQSISAGDVVDVVDGEISRSFAAVENVNTVLQGSNVSSIDVCMLTDTVGVAAYTATNAQCRSFKVDGTKITPTGIASFYNGGLSNASIERLNSTQFAVIYSLDRNVICQSGSISGNTITFSTQKKTPVSSPESKQSTIALSDNKIIICQYSTMIYLYIAEVSNSSSNVITFFTSPSLSGGIDPNDVAMALLPDDASGNKRVCVCFSDANDSYKGKAVIATIDSSNNVTWGAVTTFTNSRIATDNGAISTACIGNTVYIAYSISTGHVYATAFSVSDTGLSNQSNELQITSSTSQDPSLCTVSGSVVLSCSAPPPGSPACILSLTGNVLSAGTPFYFNNTISHYCAAAAISPSQFIVAFSDNGNGNYCTSTILTVSGNQIAGSFDVQSKDAIALQSGTAGQSIEVIFSGTTAADWATAGQEITSPGVGGYAPLDDMLWVYPWWASKFGTQIVTGSYRGTGTYGADNPTILDLPIDAKILFVECDYKVRDANMSQYPENEMLIIVSGASTALACKSTNGNQPGFTNLNGFAVRVNETGRRYSWDVANYNTPAEVQMNQSGKTYRYTAIG